MESTTHDIGLRTQYCLDQIKKRSDSLAQHLLNTGGWSSHIPLSASDKPSKAIILLGRKGVGKSTVFEHLTGAQGHACDVRGPGTTAFQLEESTINGERYFVMDTPGFDAGDEAEALVETARGILAICQHATIVGVLFVASVNYSRVENLDRKLLEFLELFCGDEYIPRITFVTTHWTQPDAAQSNRFAQLRSLWCSFLARGAGLYQHGRKYNDQHEDTGICLPWQSNRDRIAEYARNMVSRHYGGVNAPVLRILKELDGRNGLHLTSAAKCFRASPHAYNEPEDNQSREKTPQDQPPRQPEPQSTERTNSYGPSASPDPINTAWNKLAGRALEIGVDLICNVLKSQFDGIGISGPSSRPGCFSPDPNSVVDKLKQLGLPSDLESRRAIGAEHGIFNIGTAEGNLALLRKMGG